MAALLTRLGSQRPGCLVASLASLASLVGAAVVQAGIGVAVEAGTVVAVEAGTAAAVAAGTVAAAVSGLLAVAVVSGLLAAAVVAADAPLVVDDRAQPRSAVEDLVASEAGL